MGAIYQLTLVAVFLILIKNSEATRKLYDRKEMSRERRSPEYFSEAQRRGGTNYYRSKVSSNAYKPGYNAKKSNYPPAYAPNKGSKYESKDDSKKEYNYDSKYEFKEEYPYDSDEDYEYDSNDGSTYGTEGDSTYGSKGNSAYNIKGNSNNYDSSYDPAYIINHDTTHKPTYKPTTYKYTKKHHGGSHKSAYHAYYTHRPTTYKPTAAPTEVTQTTEETEAMSSTTAAATTAPVTTAAVTTAAVTTAPTVTTTRRRGGGGGGRRNGGGRQTPRPQPQSNVESVNVLNLASLDRNTQNEILGGSNPLDIAGLQSGNTNILGSQHARPLNLNMFPNQHSQENINGTKFLNTGILKTGKTPILADTSKQTGILGTITGFLTGN